MSDLFAWMGGLVGAFDSLGLVCTVLLWSTGLLLLAWLTGGIRYIDNSRVGVVEKLFSFSGSVESGLIALNREAGYQPQVLRGGLHFTMPFQYHVHSLPLVMIPQGQIGYVFARDGGALPPTQTLAHAFEASTSRTRTRSCARADSAARSARSCARARTRSTLRSSSCSRIAVCTRFRSSAAKRP